MVNHSLAKVGPSVSAALGEAWANEVANALRAQTRGVVGGWPGTLREARSRVLVGLRLARSEQPDIILLDMLMPKLSGLEVLRALRGDDATRGVKVLILSNSSREQDIAEVSNLGISGYFVKSNLSLQELGELVGRLLSGQSA